MFGRVRANHPLTARRPNFVLLSRLPGLTPGNQLRQTMGAKRAAAAEQVNSFQNTGFTTAIGAHENVQSFTRHAIQRGQDPYIPDLYLVQTHLDLA